MDIKAMIKQAEMDKIAELLYDDVAALIKNAAIAPKMKWQQIHDKIINLSKVNQDKALNAIDMFNMNYPHYQTMFESLRSKIAGSPKPKFQAA